jgi:DNA polymerase-3 subunit epsilon
MTDAGRYGALGNDDVRVLHRVRLLDGPTGEGSGVPTQFAVALDVMPTASDVAIDISPTVALRRFRYDADGKVTHIESPRFWCEDTSACCSQLPPINTASAGGPEPTDGQREEQVSSKEVIDILRSASLVISHDAASDRPWVESRMPHARDLEWACSMTQIDWPRLGLQGRSLGYLLCQSGWFHDPRDCSGGVDGLVQLLRHEFADGRTALSLLLEQALRPSWLLRANGASFGVKDALRDRGYRWDADRRLWWREVLDEERMPEELWLAENVYRAGKGARAMGPQCEEVTAATRFR